MARRLITIAVSDFLCWFPMGVLGVLSFNDVVIPDELNVAVAIFILPINSAFNPFLYTLNILIEKRQKAKEHKLLEKLKIGKISFEGSEENGNQLDDTISKQEAVKCVEMWIQKQLIDQKTVDVLRKG